VLLCCLSTTAVAAPTSKKKSGKSSSSKKSQTVRKARPALPPEPEFLPGGIPATPAAAVMVIDAKSGQVLYEKNADAHRAPASTQKLLTALIVAERGYLDQPITIVPNDTYAEPTKLGLKAGETYRRIDLVRALLVKSPNDVARALARDSAGSVEAFAELMNQRARAAGAMNSNFRNPNGLPDPAQYSSARDLAMIARAAYANPTIRSIVSMPNYVFRYNDGRIRELENTNKVLRRLPYCNGMKTGYTDAAGSCLISSASRPGRDVIVVMLGHKKPRIWTDSAAFLTWALWHGPAVAGSLQ
jgi:D-alanyl-D-alanine carboxypeptidase (penicillin-binding protein 5/6)